MSARRLTYISLGAGVQSTALLIASNRGLHGVPRADVAIFADTGDEPAAVYEHLWTLAVWSEIPVHVVTYGVLSTDILEKRRGRRARLPLFVQNRDGSTGMVRRQCTSAYKIEPIEKHVRRLLGLAKGERAPGRVSARSLLGISIDEADRMRANPRPWIENVYPLIDARLSRRACEQISRDVLGYVPTKSACVFCPFHSDGTWRALKREAPADFERAVAFDAALREREFREHGMRGLVFVHRSMRPLAEVDFGENQRDLFAEECSGVCGV